MFCSFWLIFYILELDPWICIFLRIRIQEAKILRIQQILGTAYNNAQYRMVPLCQIKFELDINVNPKIVNFRHMLFLGNHIEVIRY